MYMVVIQAPSKATVSKTTHSGELVHIQPMFPEQQTTKMIIVASYIPSGSEMGNY